MAELARSQALMRGISVGNSYPAAFVAPTNHVVLVKAAHVTNQSAASVRVVMLAVGGGASVNVYDIQMAAGSSYYWPGWLVLNPGDYIQQYTAAGQIAFWVSGAILSGPNQFPPSQPTALLESVVIPETDPPGVPFVYPQARDLVVV